MQRVLTAVMSATLIFGAGICATVSVVARPLTNRSAHPLPERHPLIIKAISALDAARADLQDAAHDYCGHRVDALEATDNALRQLRFALESDRASLDSTPKDSSTAHIENVSFEEVASTAATSAGFERHPKIRAAINALERARDDLRNAAHDYHGHRVEALESVNRALDQLGKALECDRR